LWRRLPRVGPEGAAVTIAEVPTFIGRGAVVLPAPRRPFEREF